MTAVSAQLAYQNALRAWATRAVRDTPVGGNAIQVIFAAQGAPRPGRPYVTIDIGSIVSRGRDERQGVDADGERHVVGQRTMVTTIQTHWPADDNAGDALGLAEQVRSALWLDEVQGALRAAGLSFLGAEPIQGVAVPLETGFEDRGVFVARFGFKSDQTENVGFIDDVLVDAEYQNEAEETVLEEDFWVPESPA